jgi:hypothetical protein
MAGSGSKWEDKGGTPRLRGRRGVEQRRRRLAREPICRECSKAGRVTPSAEVDHITPLSLGGPDTDDNVQCLCVPCHAIKSAMEDTSHAAASNHPDWLKPSAIPLTILAGPPGSGKTTLIGQQARPEHIVIDLDGIMMRLRPGYQHWQGDLDKSLFNKAVRVRNALLGSLSRMTHGAAWFIVSAPTEDERAWWAGKLGGQLLLLNPGPEECKRRVIARGTPLAAQGVDRWFAASRKPWSPAEGRKPVIGNDGWPIEPVQT